MDAPLSHVKFVCVLALSAICAHAAPTPPSWALVQNPDFEIYSQAGDSPNVHASLLWFEQLRAFFAASGFHLKTGERVRVIGFRSQKDYDSYRLRATADAYYVGAESRDYIVMPSLDPSKFGIAAHEYAHAVLHASAVNLPPWLNEGLAEVFSTVKISRRGCELGGDIRTRTQILRDRAWMPLSQLLQTTTASLPNGEQASLFYAESWALTEMLLLSPEYHARLPELIASLSYGQASAAVLTFLYGKSLEAIRADLQSFLSAGTLRPIAAPGINVGTIKAVSSELSPIAARSVLADLLLATGELHRAEALYRDLARESPLDPEISAALGIIALRQDDPTNARREWKLAIEGGINDATLCYRYALLAEDAGLPLAEIRRALERALALNPTFDDARFKLALLESNDGNYQSALKQLEAMRVIAPPRAFGYWLALSFAQDQLGQHADSKRSALQALHFAATEHERNQATQLAYVSDTELTVQFTRDAQGNSQMSTTRVARGTQTWNPFVEPQDSMRRADGQLRSVQCSSSNAITGVVIDTVDGSLNLTIPDPQHVLISGASEFTCGPQPPRAVTVDYAATPNNKPAAGILRGMLIR